MTSHFSYRKAGVYTTVIVAMLLVWITLSRSNEPSSARVSSTSHTQVASVIRAQSSTSTIPLATVQKEPLVSQEDTLSVQPTALDAHVQSSPSGTHDSVKQLYYVVRVIDGDTLVARMNGQLVRVRLLGINTPETVNPRKRVECFGKEASTRAKELLTGTWVYLETDPTQSTYDKYGRLLAYVFLKDGTNFDKQMITDGYGYEYTYRHRAYKYQKEFKRAQQYARIHNRGLWAPDVCSIKSK